jgi:hypothetical protein
VKKMLSLAVVFMMLFVVVGCGGSKTEGGKTDVKKPAKASGTLFEGAFMSFNHSDDWRVVEDTAKKMINLEKGSALSPTNYILIKAEKDSYRTAEEAVSTFAQTYNGSPAEKIMYNNNEYFKTSFEYSGLAQTMLVTMVGENKVTITIQGAGHQDDQSITDLLNTIVLKF